MAASSLRPSSCHLRFWQLAVTLLFLAGGVNGHATTFTDMVVFGDSHSDLGNGCVLFSPKDPDCVGLRYSNGPIWIEELASQLDLESPTASSSGGLNYAFGGARTGDGSDRISGFTPNVPRIGSQVTEYLQTHVPRDDELFVIFAGHNDWNWNSSVKPTVVVQNMATHITELANRGAKHFLISNLSLLGNAPYLRGTPRGTSTNKAIVEYNDLLSNELDALEGAQGIVIHRLDLETLSNDALNDPAAFGFTDVIHSAKERPEADPTEYLYWDYIHFTAAFHNRMGLQAAQAVMSPSRGDFDTDGQLSIADLELMAGGLRQMPPDLKFDLTEDRVFDLTDLLYWVKTLKGTWIGDANLDGEFNSGDLVRVFQTGNYEDAVSGNSTWGTGDWNADGDFSTTDLVLAFQDGGYELPLDPNVPTVPEPCGLVISTIATVSVALRFRHRTSRHFSR